MGFFDAYYFGGISEIAADDRQVTDYVLTLSDVVERAGDRIGGYQGGDSRTIRMLKRAARDALRDLPTKSDWKYYHRKFMIVTSDPVALELEYDHDTLTATVTDGTLPDNVLLGELLIDEVWCKIASVDGSELVLDSNLNPGADYEGSATWNRATYRIPQLTKIHGLYRLKNQMMLTYATPGDLAARTAAYDNTGTPTQYTVSGSSVMGANDLTFAPIPDESEQYLLSAVIAPSYPSIFQDFGEATGSSGATSVTIPEATSGWVGCVVRAAPESSSKADDLKYGEHTWQAVITEVDGTTITLSEGIPSAFDEETILVSSIVDIDLETMQTYYEALVYAYYCRNAQNENMEKAEALANRLYMQARAADSKVNQSTPNNIFSATGPHGFYQDLRFAKITRE